VVLAAAGWAVLVPYLGPAWELTVRVPARVELVDHVLPGAMAQVAAALCLVRRRRGAMTPPDTAVVAASALAVLAGFWTTATHVSVLFVAADGALSWPAALLHASAGPPLLAARSSSSSGRRGKPRRLSPEVTRPRTRLCVTSHQVAIDR
jgi:hypothetical protein